MVIVKDIIKAIEDFAPVNLQAEFDNCGLKFGDTAQEVKGVLVTLDTNVSVVQEAIDCGCNMIIEHHPSIFGAIKNFDYELPLTQAMVLAMSKGISLYSTHTNTDFTEGGLNDLVAKIIGLSDVHFLSSRDGARVGVLKKGTTLREYAEELKTILNDKNITSIGDLDKKITKVAVINGGGGGDSRAVMETFKDGCDVFVSGDVKYNVARLAKDINYAIIQVGHYTSECFFMPLIKNVLTCKIKGLKVLESKAIQNPYN